MTDLKRTEEQQPKPELTWDEAMALAATNRDELSDRLKRGNKKLAPSLWPTKHVRQVGRLRWAWRVTDQATDVVLDDGHALFERWAWHRAAVAARRINTERREAARRAES